MVVLDVQLQQRFIGRRVVAGGALKEPCRVLVSDVPAQGGWAVEGLAAVGTQVSRPGGRMDLVDVATQLVFGGEAGTRERIENVIN